MQLFEGILALILSTFLLMMIIAISYGLRSQFELISNVEKGLVIELKLLGICRQRTWEVGNLLNEVKGFLDSEGIDWTSIELLSKKNGRFFIENKSPDGSTEHETKYVRFIGVSDGDVLYITVGIEHD